MICDDLTAFDTLRDSKKRYWYDLSLRSEEFIGFWTSCFQAANSKGTNVAVSLLDKIICTDHGGARRL